MKLTDRKKINALMFLFSFTYFISYITRTNYGAIVSEMVTSTGYLKSQLSWALTGSFVTYGAGQLISGYFGDKIQPKRLVAYGLFVTVAMNVLIPFCTHPAQMAAIWCINGFAQAFMWPPMVKLMTGLFDAHDYTVCSVRVSWGGSIGTILIYLVSPALIALFSWKSVFWAAALVGIIGILVWYKFCPDIKFDTPAVKEVGSKKASFMSPLVIFIMIAIALQGILRDGVTTWMPSYISETYRLSNEISILTGIVLPLFGILCHQAAAVLYRSKLRNPMLCSGVIFGIGVAAAAVLYLFSDKSPVLSVAFSAVLTGCMHGVNLILICMIPPYFAKYGNVSMVSGALNACTYVGSAVSAYLFPLISENAGWSSTLLLWVLVAAAGTAISFVCVPSWSKFEKK